jgi:hypothetical protein
MVTPRLGHDNITISLLVRPHRKPVIQQYVWIDEVILAVEDVRARIACQIGDCLLELWVLRPGR